MLINLVSQKLEIVFHYKMASEASEETSHTQEKTFTRLYLTKDTRRKHKVMQISFFKKKLQTEKGVKLASKNNNNNNNNIQMIKKHEKVLNITVTRTFNQKTTVMFH